MRKVFLCLLLLSSVSLAQKPALIQVSVLGKQFRQGDIFAISVEGGFNPKNLEGEFLKENPIFFAGTKGKTFALMGVDIDTEPGKSKLLLRSKKDTEPYLLFEYEIDVKKGKFREEHLEVEDKFVSPSDEDLKRSEKEAAELKEIFLTRTVERYFGRKFIKPVHSKSSGRFGERRFFNGVPKNPHGGEDLKAKTGTPVKATAKGKVVFAKDTFYLGNTIVLDHGYGLFSYYGHLSKIEVKMEDVVDIGNVIGQVGSTGRATGPHLHWGIKLYNDRIDPFSLLKLFGGHHTYFDF